MITDQKIYPDESIIHVESVLGSTQNIVFASRNLPHYIESRNMESCPVQFILNLFGMYQNGESPHSVF